MTAEINAIGQQGEVRFAPKVQPPGLIDILARRNATAMSEMNSMSIGRIQAFYPEEQTADIDLMFYRVVSQQRNIPLDPKSPVADAVIPYPRLLRCPVVFLRGGDSGMTFPVEEGDTCIVLFADRDIDAWFQSGVPSAPNSNRMHDLSDGIALVGIGSLTNSMSDFSQDGPRIFNGIAEIAVEDRIKIAVASLTLGECFAALFQSLAASNLDAATKASLEIVKGQFEAVLK